MSQIKFGLVAENNLSDLADKAIAARNLGINIQSLLILEGLSLAGLTTSDLKNLQGANSNIQGQIDLIQTELSKKLSATGGTLLSPLTVNGTVQANLFLSPSGIPISTSTDSFWSATNGEISYNGNVRINGSLSVNSLSINPVGLIDLTDPIYPLLTYNRAIGLGQYRIPIALGPSLHLMFDRKSLLNQIDGSAPVTFTRASTATFTDSDGIIKVAAINAPAYEHDPITGQCLGLLSEGQFTNLNANSTPTTGWTVSGATLVTGQGTGPMGGNTFVKLQENTANSTHHLFRDITTIAGQDYTFSCFVKTAGRSLVSLSPNTTSLGISFDLTTQQISSPFGDPQGILSYNFRPFGNGMLRCWITIRAQSTTTRFTIFLINNNSSTYTGNGVDGVLIDGIQIVLGLVPCSLIPTSGSAVTKSADVITLNAPFPWISTGIGNLCAEVWCPDSQIANISPQTVYCLSDGTANNQVRLARAGYNGLMTGTVISGGAVQANLEAGACPRLTPVLAGISYELNNINVASSTDPTTYSANSATVPTGLNRLDIGSALGANHLNGVIRRLYYVPTSAPDWVNAYKPADTWGNRMVSSYERIHRHAPISPVARARLLSRLTPGSYLESTFGPSGQNKSVCDFLLVFTASKTCTSIVLASSAATRWDADGTITVGTTLANAALNEGVIIASNVNGGTAWENINIANNNLYGAMPFPSVNFIGIGLDNPGPLIGQTQNLQSATLAVLRFTFTNFLGTAIISGANNISTNIRLQSITSFAGSTFYTTGRHSLSLLVSSNNRLPQAEIDAIINQLWLVRTNAASVLASITLGLSSNVAPSAGALTQITDIRNAFIAAGKSHNITHG